MESKLSDNKKQELFDQQVALLEQFRKNGAISEAQFKISYNGLIEKMGMKRDADDR